MLKTTQALTTQVSRQWWHPRIKI